MDTATNVFCGDRVLQLFYHNVGEGHDIKGTRK